MNLLIDQEFLLYRIVHELLDLGVVGLGLLLDFGDLFLDLLDVVAIFY